MNARSPSARQPGCPALVPLGGDGTYGHCPVHRRNVYLEAADTCLCDHCAPGPDGTRRLSPDVCFTCNDIVMPIGEHGARPAPGFSLKNLRDTQEPIQPIHPRT
jgi:hypothetical protein